MNWVTIDIETVGTPWDGGKILSFAMSYDGEAAAWDTVPQWVADDVLANPEVGLVEHTLYDARWLWHAGYKIDGPIADTRVMAWNVNENTKLDLDSLVFRYLGKKMDKRLRQVGNVVKFKQDDGELVPIEDAPKQELLAYNQRDVEDTEALFRNLLDRQPKYWGDQVALTSVILDMECAGLPVDEEALAWTRESYTMTRDKLAEELTAGLPPSFNLNSADQVAAYLFLNTFPLKGRVRKGEELPDGFTVEKEGRLWLQGHYDVTGLGLQPGAWTDSGKRPKTDSKTLAVRYGKHAWVASYLEYQKINKILGTYLEGLPRYIHGGRLYGTFNQAGTVSGRLSSANPNLQNLPRRGQYGADMRKLFAGKLIISDFSQLEPRIMAHRSQDPKLLAVYRGGGDIYKTTATSVFGDKYHQVSAMHREICKTLVLSMGYGAQARKVAEILSVAGFPTTQKEAQHYLDGLRATYPTFFEWREATIQSARETGYITTLAGRKRHIGFDDMESAWKAERQAVNSDIQGSAADIVNATMLEVNELDLIQMLVQVHDELVMEYFGEVVPLAEIQYAGEHGHGFELSVPLVFEPAIVENWGQK